MIGETRSLRMVVGKTVRAILMNPYNADTFSNIHCQKFAASTERMRSFTNTTQISIILIRKFRLFFMVMATRLFIFVILTIRFFRHD